MSFSLRSRLKLEENAFFKTFVVFEKVFTGQKSRERWLFSRGIMGRRKWRLLVMGESWVQLPGNWCCCGRRGKLALFFDLKGGFTH